MNTRYPFDPSFKHHVYIALGLALWIFLFLYFTEPMDVNEFGASEKLIYLPIYGLLAGVCYLMFWPLQTLMFSKNNAQWHLKHELLFLMSFIVITLVAARLYYLYVIVAGQPNPYSLSYHVRHIFLPAMTVILPILIIGRFAFGKYKNKKLEDTKIVIEGEGNYESIRLLPNDLIYIQSSDNYIEVVYVVGKDLKKTLIRNKLSVIAENFPQFIRTHRSYVINPYHFQSWKTEKGKPFVTLSQGIEVPISKTYLESTKAQLHFATES